MGKKSVKRQICHTQADGSRVMDSPASMDVLSTWSLTPTVLLFTDTERRSLIYRGLALRGTEDQLGKWMRSV